MSNSGVYQTDFPGLKLVHRGKVRDLYQVDDQLLIVASDRVSAYDVVMKEIVPQKGIILTRLSLFWFDYLSEIMPNHLISSDPAQYPLMCAEYQEQLRGRSMLVKKLKPLPVECIVRGYLSGSLWQAYQKSSTVCGLKLPSGLKESDKLPQPIFTPSTKAAVGGHDENISIELMVEMIGSELTDKAKHACLALYKKAAEYALRRGIIIADTKFELGLDECGNLVLIDEVLTPDSSRFWPAEHYRPGRGQESFDKQFVRDYLSSIGWDKSPPPPSLPDEVVVKTRQRYEDAICRLLGEL